MATLKAKLKRTIENVIEYGPSPTRITTFLNLTEPINGWTINNAVVLIDSTLMAFDESSVSSSGAIRCTNVLTLYDGYGVIKNSWGAVEQLEGSGTSNCRVWPCCAVGSLMRFPLIYAANASTPAGVVMTPGVEIKPGGNPIEYIQLYYGNSHDSDLKFYISIDMMLFEGAVP